MHRGGGRAYASRVRVCGAERIEIRVDPENAASLAIPRKLGFVEEGTLRGVLHGPDGTAMRNDGVVFALMSGELEGSPSADAQFRAFDAAGNEVAAG